MMRNACLWLLALALAGCAGGPARHPTTYDQINADLANGGTDRVKPARPEAVGAALLPPLRVEMPAMGGKPLEQRFDLVVNNAPANQVFMGIVNGTKYSMLVSPDITGTISVNLKDVTVFEALDAIREMYGYEYKVEGARIYIQPMTMQIRIYKVNYLIGRRSGGSDLRVSSGSISTSSSSSGSTNSSSTTSGSTTSPLESSGISTVTRTDFWAELEDSVRTVIGCKMTTRSGGGVGGVATAGMALGASGQGAVARSLSGQAQPRDPGEESMGRRGVDGCEGGRSVVVNPMSGVLVVRAMPAEQRDVNDFLKASQLSVERQVILEAKILQVELRDGYQAGVNWAGIANMGRSSVALGRSSGTFVANSGTNTGVQLTTTTYDANGNAVTPTSTVDALNFNPLLKATGGIFGIAIANQNFATMLEYLQTQGNVQVLSSPRIATLNNQKAVLKIGTDEYFVTGVTSNNTTTAIGATSTPTVTVSPFFSGIALDVTPQIDEDNMITLHVHPSVSKVSTVTKIVDLGTAGSMSLPLASSDVSETDSVIRAMDGQVVAIGGLMKQTMSETRSQVPGAGDIPFLGALLRQTNQTSVKTELVILLKPTVIKDDATWQHDLQDSQRRVESMNRGFSYGGRSEVFGVGAESRRPPAP